MQVRYNAEDDCLERLQLPKRLCQKGYEWEENACSVDHTAHLNHVFVNPIPLNKDCSEWVHLVCPKHMSREMASYTGLIPVKFRYDNKTQLYQWIETGDLISSPDEDKTIWEGAIAEFEDGYVITPRVTVKDGHALSYVKTKDPFAGNDGVEFKDWVSNVPLTCYKCADGKTRILTGNIEISPNKSGRSPIYAWDLESDLSLSNIQTVIDPIKENILPGEAPHNLCVDFPKVLTHTGGNKQTVIFRLKTFNLNHTSGSTPPMTKEQLAVCGLYHAEITYDQDYPAEWDF
jgi:hypothetical protein